jgi:hypothetical protein
LEQGSDGSSGSLRGDEDDIDVLGRDNLGLDERQRGSQGWGREGDLRLRRRRRRNRGQSTGSFPW